MVVVWIGAVLVGLGAALVASRKAVDHASTLAFGLKVPPFLIGLTLLAIGTDLPEIANSIVASVSDHGDLNVGDSVGSTITQVTLVLGLLPILARHGFTVGRDRVLIPSLIIAGQLAVVAFLLHDGQFGRLDGAVLLCLWVGGSFLLWHKAPSPSEPAISVPSRRKAYHVAAAVLALAIVGAGATLAVVGLIELAEAIGVPEFIVAFFGTAIGTSLPELVVAVTAIRSGERDLAIGDVFGASLLDSSLSIGIGPLIAPTAITADLAVASALAGAGTLLIIAVLMSRFERHNAWTGLALLALYAAFFPLLLMIGSD
ncbi:MAG: sodium:calcium antiporter [Acidimicrobiia bacterium]|nr:sodium:calcium antiporter [Acidimicrobiia bacterium]